MLIQLKGTALNTCLDCIPCFMRQALEAARSATADASLQGAIMRDALGMAAGLDLSRSPPVFGQAIHRRVRELTGADPYRAAKERFNRLALELLPELAAEVQGADDPLVAAGRLAIAANAMDLGIYGALTEDDARRALHEAHSAPVEGDWAHLRRAAAGARRILYLADNAGELVVDRLLVEQLGPERVTVVVRGGPVLNDVTLDDARAVGMDTLCEVIDNGSDAPATVLEDCSAEFRRRFEEADLIVSKGQGNAETLLGVDAPVFFLFKVKCRVIADHVGLPVGTHAALWARALPVTRAQAAS